MFSSSLLFLLLFLIFHFFLFLPLLHLLFFLFFSHPHSFFNLFGKSIIMDSKNVHSFFFITPPPPPPPPSPFEFFSIFVISLSLSNPHFLPFLIKFSFHPVQMFSIRYICNIIKISNLFPFDFCTGFIPLSLIIEIF